MIFDDESIADMRTHDCQQHEFNRKLLELLERLESKIDQNYRMLNTAIEEIETKLRRYERK